MGIGLRIMPGVRISASSRGIRAGIGPRMARMHVGSGGLGLSTGAGPLTLYTGAGGGRRRSTRSSVAAVERQARQAMRAEQFEAALAADNAVMELLSVHQAEFSPAVQPQAPLGSVDENAIQKGARKAALQGIGVFDRRARHEAKAQAAEAAAREIEAEHQRVADARDRAQAELDAAWQRLLSNDPETVITQLEAAFEDNEMPAAPLDVQDDRLVLAMSLPPKGSIIPEKKAAQTPSGTPTVHKRNKTEQNAFYLGILASNVIATAKEAFAVAPGVHYATVLAILKDDFRKVVEPLYVGSFRRSALEKLDFSKDDVLEEALSRALVNQKGKTRELAPLDLSEEEDLRQVTAQMEIDLGFRQGKGDKSSIGATDSETAEAGRYTGREEDEPMRAAEEVPVVRENAPFLVFERARLAAMQDANSQTEAEGRLAGAMVVVKLSELQVDECSELMEAAREELPTYDARRDEFQEWFKVWLSTAERHLTEWSEFQLQLVDHVGEGKAQEIAERFATPRVRAVVESVEEVRSETVQPSENIANRVRQPLSADRGDATHKTCPDCAEEVKAAARICRFCGFRFEERAPGVD